MEFVRCDELDGTVVKAGTILTSLMKTHDLTKMAFVFWQVVITNILLHVGHHSELSSYVIYSLWRILNGSWINMYIYIYI